MNIFTRWKEKVPEVFYKLDSITFFLYSIIYDTGHTNSAWPN